MAVSPCSAMRPGESGGRLRWIKGSQDIVLFKEEGDIYCLKERKQRENKDTHTHKTRQTHTHTGTREREKMAAGEVQKWLGWAWLVLKVAAED